MSREYFQHDYNARNDLKMQALIYDYKSAGTGLFWIIVEMLHEETENRLPDEHYTYIAIAKQSNESVEFVSEVLSKMIKIYKLFFVVDGFIYSDRVKRNLKKRSDISEERKEAGKKGAEARIKTLEERKKRLEELNELQELEKKEAENLANDSKDLAIAKTDLAIAQQNLANKRKEKKSKLKESNNIAELPLNVSAPDNNSSGDKSPDIQRSFKQWTVDDFKNEILKHAELFPVDMRNKFYRYWKEESAKKKMRFQLEQTWCTKSRLETWRDNNELFERKKPAQLKGITNNQNLDTNAIIEQRKKEEERIQRRISGNI